MTCTWAWTKRGTNEENDGRMGKLACLTLSPQRELNPAHITLSDTCVLSYHTRNEPQQKPHLPDREVTKLRKALMECGAMAYNPRSVSRGERRRIEQGQESPIVESTSDSLFSISPLFFVTLLLPITLPLSAPWSCGTPTWHSPTTSTIYPSPPLALNKA